MRINYWKQICLAHLLLNVFTTMLKGTHFYILFDVIKSAVLSVSPMQGIVRFSFFLVSVIV